MELKEAYDVNGLVDRLKAKGLDLAEEGAKIAVAELLEWIKESAAKSSTPFDDIVVTVIPLLQAEIDKQIDKIDGEVG